MKTCIELVKSNVAEGAGNTYSATNHPLVLARSGFMKASQIIPPAAAERAFTRWVESADGCLISTYSVASHGYAQIGWNRTSGRGMTTAHRAAWVHANGQIPDGMTIDHMCKNRRCVNVKHLRVLSNFENARRTSGRDWPLGECANGHPNSEIIPGSNGKLKCRPCTLEYSRRYTAKNPEKVRETQRRSNAKRRAI